MADGKRFDTAELNIDRPEHAEETPRRKKRKRREKKERRIPRWVYRVILILVLCVLGMLIWFNRNNLSPSNIMDWIQDRVVGMGVGDGFPSTVTRGTEIHTGNFKSVNKEIVMVSDTALVVLNSTAKELANRQHSFGNPIMKANGSRTLIYNLGGKGYQVESHSKTLVKKNMENNILAGALASNGKYALVTQADGYCGMLTAYSAEGNELFKYWFADYYPTAVALSSDGTKAAVTAVAAKDGGMISAVYLLDFSVEGTVQPAAEYAENMMVDIFYSDDGVVMAVGDQGAGVIDTASNAKSEYDYGGLQLSSYAGDNGQLALSLTPYQSSNSAQLVVLDRSGKASFRTELTQNVKSVSLYGDAVAALAGDKIYNYSISAGRSLGTGDAGSDARAIALKDESSAYILGVSEVRLAELK